MGVREILVVIWFVLSIIAQFYGGIILIQAKNDYVSNKSYYNRMGIYISIDKLNLFIVLSFLLSIYLSVSLWFWTQGKEQGQKCGAVMGIIFAVFQTFVIITGPSPFLFFIPILAMIHLIMGLKKAPQAPNSDLQRENNQRRPQQVTLINDGQTSYNRMKENKE